ncbi:acidic repeat-containing protein [Drosophila innubila]|uniref:acidic repeat-containing protein n=1 Tax=Drosophila innubila TaxID=198719 RepID=UPI00148BFA7D|nr:acidic repeat-containing protein [Drosophila innubila]
MSDDISHSNSVIEAFEYLNIASDDDECDSCVPQLADATHDLSCRMPQTAGDVDVDNCDDTSLESESDSNSSLDYIVVVDTSDAPSETSFLRPSDLNSDSDVQILDWDSDTNTIPETDSDNDSDSDTNGSPTGPSIMDKRVSTPIKRKHECRPKSKEKQSPNDTSDLSPEVDSLPVITTRSGRAVRQRMDHKFDYSSSNELSVDNCNDPDFGDHEDEDEDDDDDDDDDDADDEDYNEQDHVEPKRKQRRLSFHSSCCSSSNNSSSMAETDTIIYLDLRQSVAIVSSEPTSDPAVEYDSELKTRLNKFLGLMPAQRRLYNPMANYELQDNHMDENDNPPTQTSRLWATSSSVQSKATTKLCASPMPSLLKRLGSEISNEMKMLLIDDIVQRANANCFETQTPQHIKEPIDLSSLPREEQRTRNCQQHKKIHTLLDPCAGYYSFLDSLRSETPLNMCHPLAVDYRQRDFEVSKTKLAKTLFNALNHTVFYCGLRSSIVWKNSMNTLSSIVHGFDSSGQRVSRIILWQQMKYPGVLVKALLHEMCHAAAFVYHGETGHGDNCRKWAYRAKSLLPELPQIDDCNSNYKYTCLLCRGRSFGIMKFECEDQRLRCHYCQFEVNVETCNVEYAHNLSLTDQLVTPYKKFVQANYTKNEESSHSSKMRALNVQYKEQLQQTASN